jgi:hypothetical protein
MLVGDDGGYVNVFKMKRKFLIDNTQESEADHLTPHYLTKRDAFEKYNIMMFMVRSFSELHLSENATMIGLLKLNTTKK